MDDGIQTLCPYTFFRFIDSRCECDRILGMGTHTRSPT